MPRQLPIYGYTWVKIESTESRGVLANRSSKNRPSSHLAIHDLHTSLNSDYSDLVPLLTADS